MPLQSADVKILKADTQNDTAAGGGEITAIEVVDNVSNSVFPDVSQLDRTFGRVNMRKLYTSVNIQTLDVYFGAHTIISAVPKDTKLGINMFVTNNWHDRRDSAENRVAAYRAQGSQYQGFLFNTQFQGSKIVTIFQNENARIPDIAEVLLLSQFSGSEEQFIKITDVSSEVLQFTTGGLSFPRRIVTLEISQALDFDFVGASININDNLSPQASISETIVADAAKFYSTRPLATAITNGESFCEVDTVYSQLIPSSLQELALVDIQANGIVSGSFSASTNTISIVTSNQFTANTSVYLGSSVEPTTLDIVLSSGSLIDNGGNITDNGVIVGSIDYPSGVILFNSTSPVFNGSKTINFKVASNVSTISDTDIIDITDGNRGNIYNRTLGLSTLSKGGVRVHFRILGNWFTLTDNATGGLIAQDSGIGSGTINYTSRTVSISLTNQPDVGSAILYEWSTSLASVNLED